MCKCSHFIGPHGMMYLYTNKMLGWDVPEFSHFVAVGGGIVAFGIHLAFYHRNVEIIYWIFDFILYYYDRNIGGHAYFEWMPQITRRPIGNDLSNRTNRCSHNRYFTVIPIRFNYYLYFHKRPFCHTHSCIRCNGNLVVHM